MDRTSLTWVVAVGLLVSASAAAGYDLGASADGTARQDDAMQVTDFVTRFVDDDASVVCYVADFPDGAGVDCLPLGRTTLDDAGRTTGANRTGWSVTSPTGTYVLGGRTALRGQAPTGVESVVLYARADGEWQLVDADEDGRRTISDAIPVGGTGRWERRRVALSNASDVLAAPGRYTLAAVATADALADDGALPTTVPPDGLDPGATTAIDVVSPAPEEPAVFADVAGQVATEDGVVDVRGFAPGSQAVLVLAVDRRGTVASEVVSVDGSGLFDEAFALVGPDGDPLSEGFTVGIVLSPGRDGRVGNGEIQGETGADLEALEIYVQERTAAAALSQRQVLEIVEAETVADAGSDDLRLVDTFAFTDARTTVEAVYPANRTGVTGVRRVPIGETMVVEGTTNRRPEENAIFVDVVNESTGETVASAATEAWEPDGNWAVRISTADLQPGTYTVQADDGDDRDAVRVVVSNATAAR